jgi:DNA-binding Lrp family transcriptional regulator
VYLKIAGSEREQKKFFDHIRTKKDVFWLGVADGAWDVGLTFFEKSNEDFFKKKNELFAKFNKIILDKKTGTVVNVYVYPKKFFTMRETEPGTLFGDVAYNKIDEIEKKILKVLLHNSRISLVDLAKEVGSTLEVVRHRKKKLEQAGIISVYTTSINYEKLGLEFYKTFLYFDKLDEKDEKKLLEFCRLNKNIMHMVRVICPWDIELEVMVKNYAEYNKIMRELRSLFPHEIRNIESAIMSGDYPFPAKKTIFD